MPRGANLPTTAPFRAYVLDGRHHPRLPMNVYRTLADVVVLAHFAYVLFVVFGLVATLVGVALRRPWARNFWFRVIHLTMIAIVVIEAILGITCPLTTLENRLRLAAGEQPHALDFIERWLHSIMFFRAPAWAFAVLYLAFGAAVLGTFLLAPPRWPTRTKTVGTGPKHGQQESTQKGREPA